MMESQPQGVLEPGYRLLWYRIGRILGRGAFGTTYLAEDINLHRPVAIKEFFPTQYCTRQANSTQVEPLSSTSAEDYRWAMDRFLSEARTLAQFEHPNIIRVINVFEANGTAYMVMQYESGISLSALLKKRRTLQEQELVRIIMPVLDGLEKVHDQGFIHRDIKPANIYIRDGGSPVLLDFGSARQSMQEHTQTLTSLVSPGYAPIEQYTSKGERQGPWTDIYGMGATLYRAVTGLLPPAAVDRSEALSEGKEDYMTKAGELVRSPYSQPLLDAIDHALAYRINERPQRIADWRKEFGINLADIDTQPDYGPGEQPNPNDQDSISTTRIMTAGEQQAEHEMNNIADTEGDTEVNTAPTEQAGPGMLSPIINDNTTASRPRSQYLVYGLMAALVLAVAVTTTLFRSPITTPASGVGDNAPATVQQLPANDSGNVLPESEQIQQLLEAARRDIDAIRLTKPADNNAYDKFRRILALDGDNAEAQRGIDAIYKRYLQLAQRAIQDDEFDRAGEMLKRAAIVKPQAPGLTRARVRLEQQRTETRIKSLSKAMDDSGTSDNATESNTGNTTDGSTGISEAIQRMLGNGS